MIRITLDELEKKAESLGREKKKLNECLKHIDELMGTLPDSWESEVCDKYIEEYRESRVSISDMETLLGEIIFHIETVCRFIKRLE